MPPPLALAKPAVQLADNHPSTRVHPTHTPHTSPPPCGGGWGQRRNASDTSAWHSLAKGTNQTGATEGSSSPKLALPQVLCVATATAAP